MPDSRIRPSSSRNASGVGERVRPARREVDLLHDLLEPVLRHERQDRLAHGGAVGRQASADVEVEIDVPLARPRRPAALDVDDVDVVEDREVDRVAGLVAELPQMRSRDLAEIHRVDRGEAEIEDTGAEPVALRVRVLLQVPELGKRRDVPVSRAPAQFEVAGELADADQRAIGVERRENCKATLKRLRGARASLRGWHSLILARCSINWNTVLTNGQSAEKGRLRPRTATAPWAWSRSRSESCISGRSLVDR